MQEDVQILEFQPQFAGDFARLNYDWIEEHFVIEEHDREMLDHPQKFIIDTGGQIFFALSTGEVVGTVALISVGDDSFELAKMAVSPTLRGKGIGDLLIERCREFAVSVGRRTIFLLSNTKLVPAIKLYKKHGYVETPLDPISPYERVDIRMELDIWADNKKDVKN